MDTPVWLNKQVIIAGLAVLGTHSAMALSRTGFDYLMQPVYARDAIDMQVARHVLSGTGEAVRCQGPRRGPWDWWRTDGLRVCYSPATRLRVPTNSNDARTQQDFAALAYTGTTDGQKYAVLSSEANRIIRLHEGRHLQRGEIQGVQHSLDRVVALTYGEGDAYLAEIIGAYQNYMATGDTEEWDMVNTRSPLMVRVFDTLLAQSPNSQQALAQGRLPSARIMRRTLMAYLFSEQSQRYLQNFYRRNYQDLDQRLEAGQLNITVNGLGAWLHYDGVQYARGGRDAGINPLDPWLLHTTLGMGLPDEQRATLATYETNHQMLTNQLAEARREDDTPRIDTLIAALTALELQSPRSRAWRAAGLAAFMDDAGAPLPAPTVEPVGGPRRAVAVALHDEHALAAVMPSRTATMPPAAPQQSLRTCNLFALAKIGHC